MDEVLKVTGDMLVSAVQWDSFSCFIVNLTGKGYNGAIGKFRICCTALSWIMAIRRNGWYSYWKEG